ncbi:helix-turn-helix domain-containing protein [Sedimenticola hydrogenitrophicus]|uniref:helix-turn-helix domain-containing protein n=1 Tax=Sedimenticola hydrogenitrophicus TaxID=2967975 RepID=UPI0021A271C1|nr:helix-turn-helix domain-containing protein [Sedimenticola hydrogenitrophicus]
MNTSRNMTSLPNTEDASLARASAQELSSLLAKMPQADRAQVRLDGHDLILPRQALALLRDVLSQMAQGNAVTIVPTHAELTTQEAANILNVSRPYLIKLLDEGKIPYHKVNKHRRIRFEALMEYKCQQDTESAAALDELARQAQELDMGY